jgi:hypothetical protein
MKDFNIFFKQIKQKVLVFYFKNILRPLSIQKQKDISIYERRKDYHDSLYLRQNHKEFIHKYFVEHKESKID